MPQTYRLSLSGLNCASCVARAEQAIGAVDAVQSVSVNLANETAQIDAPGGALVDVANALENAGYPARQSQIRLQIEGMNCASCVGKVESILRDQAGVLSASVNLATGQAHVHTLDGIAQADALAKLVSAAGYAASAEQTNQERSVAKATEQRTLARAALIAAVLTLPVFAIEMLAHFIPAFHHWSMTTIGTQNSWLLQFALITLVMIWPGRIFYQKGIPALVRRAPDMNSLVALGTLAAWIFSSLAVFAPQIFPSGTRAVYFEAAGVIITLILLGRWFEARAKGRTGAAIQRLVALQPASVQVLRGDTFVDLPLADVAQGDVLQLRPGGRVAVDGDVLTGSSFIDESMLSGEPVPIEKQIGAQVSAGTINGTGALTYRARAVGSDTVLARIIRMVEDAQGAKLPIQSLVDKITGIFVPIVLALAALTVLVWLAFGPDPALGLALVSGISVLIIACPCAMGLATPTSIMVGTGRAAELGVLFRKGDALQGLQDAKIIALDKTGTLTKGAPELTTLALAKDVTREEALPMIAALEHHSEHPIAAAIVRAAQGFDLPKVTDFKAIVGMGVQGRVNGKTVLVGADRFMQGAGIAVDAFAKQSDEIASAGATPLFAAFDGKCVALIGVSDPIKPSTPGAIDALQKLGLKVAMITGDNARTAQAVAQSLGIDEVVAEVLPDGKVAAIETLRAKYGALAFVGDGINDAPALAHADTGVAIGTGTDIAIEAADVVLMSGALTGAVNAVTISRASMKNIRQNLFWAFAYNVALIPIAAGVLYPLTGALLSPMLAAGAMALSSVFVISNALRLRFIKPALH